MYCFLQLSLQALHAFIYAIVSILSILQPKKPDVNVKEAFKALDPKKNAVYFLSLKVIVFLEGIK